MTAKEKQKDVLLTGSAVAMVGGVIVGQIINQGLKHDILALCFMILMLLGSIAMLILQLTDDR